MIRSDVRLRRVRRLYYLVSALVWFSAVLPMAIVVLFAQARGFSLFEVGLYVGLYTLTVALLEVPTGGWADTIGRVRVALASYALTIVSLGVLLFAFSLPALFTYAVLHGAARALGSGALQAWFVDAMLTIDPGVDLQPPLAVANTWELLGLALGTLSGGTLPTLFAWLPADGSAVLTPLATPLLASMAMHAVVIGVVASAVREPRRPAGAAAPDAARPNDVGAVIRGAFALARSNPAIALLLGIEVLSGFALTGMETFWQPFFAARIGPERTWILGALLAGGFAVGMLGNLLAIPASRWFGRRYALVAAAFKLLQALALVALAYQQGFALAAGSFWLAYFALGGGNSPLATLFHAEVPSDRRSVMLSVQSLASFAGGFVGSVCLGWLAQAAGIGPAWVVAGAALVGSVGLLVGLDRRLHGKAKITTRTRSAPPHRGLRRSRRASPGSPRPG